MTIDLTKNTDSKKISEIQSEIIKKINKLGKIQNLDPNIIKNLGDWMRMELTYTSNALEGNTLTRKETKLVVEEGISIGGKSVVEILEVKNHSKALELVEVLAREYLKKLEANLNINIARINISNLFKIHGSILQGINDDNAGKFRNVAVRISGSTTILPNYIKVPTLIEQMVKEINDWESQETRKSESNESSFNYKNSVNIDPIRYIDLAIKAHYGLVTIHPFVDGNGRTARLLFNLILLQSDLPIVFIAKEDRSEYLSALEKAQNGGSSEDYYILMYKAVIRSLDLYLDQVNNNVKQLETSQPPTLLKIGQLSTQSGESVANVRYWTSLGLIRVYNTTKSGYSLYHPDCLVIIKQIRFLQNEKRLSLEEIGEVINK
jgi:Fic family protein